MTSDDGSTSNGGWHAIRPWSPPLSLNTREVTSVSVTFILSSHLTDVNDDALGLILAEEAGNDEDRADESHDAEGLETKKKSIISDALAKGLSVNVNGSSWQRVFIRVDDAADEAIIIIYGLMPGRQYDIDLGLVKGDSNNKIRRQVVTEGTQALEIARILEDLTCFLDPFDRCRYKARAPGRTNRPRFSLVQSLHIVRSPAIYTVDLSHPHPSKYATAIQHTPHPRGSSFTA